MSSKKHKGRSRSPPHSRRDRRSSIHRQYRERDNHNRYGFDDGQHPHSYDAGIRSGQDDNRNRSDDRGPSPQPCRRESSQGSQPHRGSMLPPPSMPPRGPRPSIHSGQSNRAKQKRPSRNEEPKKIPDDLRDRCGACNEDHDIRFCPYPNTDNGQTKSCPICDTTKHAWCQCEYYDPTDWQAQWDTCWQDRRGLPSLVHDEHLHEVFMRNARMPGDNKLDEARARDNSIKAGPLTPDFVQRLMPPKENDQEVQSQLLAGRKLPWDVPGQELNSCLDRPDKLIEDPATKNMQLFTTLDGTRTAGRDIPKAYKLPYFRQLHRERREQKTAGVKSNVHDHVRSKQPQTGHASTIARLVHPDDPCRKRIGTMTKK